MGVRERLAVTRTRFRRAVLLRRRWLAAGLVGVATLAGLQAAAAPPAPSTSVLVAARDLPAGELITAADLTVVDFADDSVPSGTVERATAQGRTLAAPLRAGEPVTDVRLVGAGLLQGYPGLVAVPIRIPDSAVVDLLKVGDEIDLLATDPGGSGTERIAASVPVLALPRAADTGSDLQGPAPGGRLIVVGNTPETARNVADAATQGYLSIALTS
jgi:Flp pilus assembly protein CpaB